MEIIGFQKKKKRDLDNKNVTGYVEKMPFRHTENPDYEGVELYRCNVLPTSLVPCLQMWPLLRASENLSGFPKG